MLICPNINTPEWVALEKSVGRFEAFRDFMQRKGEIRTPAEVLEKLINEGRLASPEVKYSKPDIGDPVTLMKESAESLMEFLEKKFPGLKGAVINDKKKVWKGKLEGGKTPTINLAYAELSDGFHEFAHPFLMSLRKANPATFNSLFEDLMKAPEWEEIRKRAASRVERLYPELAKGSIQLFKEEVMATAIGYAAEHKLADSIETSEPFSKWITKLFKMLNELFNEFLSVFRSTNELTPSTTFAEVIDMLTDTKTKILLDENWDKLIDSQIAADAMTESVTTSYDNISDKLSNDLQAAIIVNKAFSIDEFMPIWIAKNFKVPGRPYKPRKVKPSDMATTLAQQMITTAMNKGYRLSGKEIPKLDPGTPAPTDIDDPFNTIKIDQAVYQLAQALTPLDLNYKFSNYLTGKKNIAISLKQLKPAGLTDAESYAVDQFQQYIQGKFPTFKSMPADKLNEEYIVWVNENYGINWIEGKGHEGYGIDRIMTSAGKMDKYTRVVFIDDYFNQGGHSFQLKNTELSGNGLGWYARVDINGERFDHEFQSDILPEIHKSFKKGDYDDVGETRVNLRKSREAEIRDLAQQKINKQMSGTPDKFLFRTRLWQNVINEFRLSTMEDRGALERGFGRQPEEDLDLPFSKIDNWATEDMTRDQELMLSELDVEIQGMKDRNSDFNYIAGHKAYLKALNLFLGRKSAEQKEMFDWIKTFKILSGDEHQKILNEARVRLFGEEPLRPDDDLPFSKTEGTEYTKIIGVKGGKFFYFTLDSINNAPAFVKKMVDVQNGWAASHSIIKPATPTTEMDVMSSAASAVVNTLFDNRGELRKNFGNHKKAVQMDRNRMKDITDKVFNKAKFRKAQVKGLQWRKEVYKNPNNILKIAEFYKGQLERYQVFYNGIYDDAVKIAKEKETPGGGPDPMYNRYRKYNDLYFKWFDIIVQQSINSAKAEGRDHYFLPTAEAMAKVEGNSSARKIYITPGEMQYKQENRVELIARYIASNTPESAAELKPWVQQLRDNNHPIGETPESIAHALQLHTNFPGESNVFHDWIQSSPRPSTEETGPFYNALAKFAKKNNIKLTIEAPIWSSANLIKVDLSKYNVKPIDRFSKVDVQMYKNEAKRIIQQKFGTTFLKKGDISANQLGNANLTLSKMYNGGDMTWSLKLSSKGNYYLAGYKNGAVLMDNYYSPYGPYRTAYYKEDKPTGSVVELAIQDREKYPLNNETNDKTQAIEILTEMARGLSNQLGTGYQFVTSDEARRLTNNEWNGEPGFFIGGISYFVGDNLRPDIILHEFSHPLIRSIAITNPKLFNSLYDRLAGTAEGKIIIDEVTKNYTNLEPGSDMFKEECLVRSLVLAAKLDASPVKEPVGFAKFIKDLLIAVKQLLRSVFGQKVDVAKLSPNTSLIQIADMLMAGKNFKIETDRVSEDDTVAYMKDMTGYINDMSKISKPELMALTTRVFDIATKHIDIVQNNKNYAEMLHILADEYERGDLQEIRKNLSKYANRLSNRLNDIKDEVQFNRNHAAAMVDTFFRLETMVEKILAHMEDLSTDTNNKDNLQKAFYYDSLLKYWSGFIKEAKDALDEQKIPSSSPMSQIISSIDRTLDKSKSIAQTMSAAGIKDVLFDELMPIAKTIDQRYQTIIADLKKRGASQAIIDKWHKEYHGLSEKDQARLDELEKGYTAGRLTTELRKEYDTLKLQSFDGAKLTKEKLEKALKGELGDANAFNSFFEGYMYNTDPIVGGFALYVKNHMTDVLTNAQAKFNTFATDMKPLLEAAGYNPVNVADLASKITHIQKIGTKDKDGNLVSRDIFTFLSPHQNYRFTLDEHRHAIEVTEKAYSLSGSKEDQDKMIDAISGLKSLQRNYFYQDYVPEYYNLEGILERDDIGKKAAYLRDNIFERMRDITRTLETQGDEMKFADQIDELWAEYRQLNSRYDLNGKLKTGDDLAIAERLREHKDAARKFHEWKERKGVFQNSLKSYEQELITSGIPQDSDTFKIARTEWINRNTRTVVKQSFYEKRKLIMDRISTIMSKIPDSVKKSVDIGPLYQAITDISYTSRDDDNQPNAQDMTPESIAEVKDLQERIIKAQKAFAGLNGLTEAESQELSSLFEIIKGGRRLVPEERSRMDGLLAKKNMSGLGSLAKAELFKLFADLDIIQRREATDYYVDVMNNWLEKLDTTKLKEQNKVGIINKITAGIVLEDEVLNDLLSQDQDFAKWFRDNHIQKIKWNPETKIKERIWERVAVWNVIRPTDPADYETTNITDTEGNILETIQGLPTTKYYVRRVKNEFRTKKIVGQTVDNRGQWLPRLDVADRRFVNEEYYRLQREDPKLFAVLQKMSEHHLKNQEGLGYKSRLYLDVPRFRKNTLEMVQTQQLKRTIKGAVAGRLPLLTAIIQRMKLFWQRGKDATEQGLNPHNDFMLVRADMFDNEVSSIPIAGLYDIDITDVSTDLTHSMMRYMLSAERQKKLIEINPVARALQSVVNDDKNQVKRLDAVNRFNFINRGVITYLNKKGFNTRRSAVNNFIEREFEGQTNTGMLTDVPWLNNTAQLIFKRASFGFFALNIPSALKNTLGAKFQGMIEAAGGKYMTLKSFAKGEAWAFNTMGQVSFEIYKKGPKSVNIQLVEIFDAIQGRFEEKFGESMSRTLASDTANLSWLYNFRKWTESQATLQAFAGMMHHQKVMQNGKEIDYINAWELRNGKIQLKDGVDPEWGITYDKDGVMKIGSQFKMMKNRVQQVINSLNGAYASFDQPEAQRYLAFRFVSFLRRYFTAMAVNRWGFSGGFGKARGRLNPGLGDVNEGYYITVMKTLNRMVTTDAKYLGFMTKDEKIAWIKTTTELFALIALSMLLAPMFGWDPDDVDKYEKLRSKSGAMPFFGMVPEDPEHPFEGAGFLENHLLSLAMQVRSENEQFVPWPNFGLDDYTSMLDLKSLATGPTLKAYKQMFTVGLDQVTGDPSAYYKRSIGPYEWQQEGGSKFFNYLFKALGMTGSSLDPATAIKNSQGIIIRGK